MSEQAPKTPRQLGQEAAAMRVKHREYPIGSEEAYRENREIEDMLRSQYGTITEKNHRDAAEHYRDNAALFHELGVLEAAMDGVEIQVQQPESQAETIEVHTSQEKM